MDSKQRLIDLLAERATEGLDQSATQELEALLGAHPEWDNDSFDLAAAAIDEALSGPAEPMPELLRDRLLLTAGQFVANSSSSDRDAVADKAESSGATVRSITDRPASPVAAEPAIPAWAGWTAAAAALLIAALAWWPAQPVPGSLPDVQEQRALLLADAGDAQQLPWQATTDPTAVGASGDVVWSGTRQQGYMRIRGLEANDPGLHQYQLWIFDAQRDDRFPVDGGVFDVPAGVTEVVVPIAAKLPVDEAVLFAVTVERPGGVVVSDRERIALLAQQDAGN